MSVNSENKQCVTESDCFLILAIDLKPMKEVFFFFSCIILSVPHIQSEVVQCSLHFIFRCSLSHHSLIPSILLLSASRYFADTVYPYTPSLHTFDHLYSQSRGKFTAHTPTSCISSLHLEVYK